MARKEDESTQRAPTRRQVALDPFGRLREFDLFPRSGFLDEWFRDRPGAVPMPAVDVSETDEAYVITAELPGLAKEDVTVEVHDGVLSIRGEKRSEREEGKERSRWTERTYGAFHRSFSLPADADADRCSASFKDGVLRLELAKTAEAKPRVISVRGG